MDIAESVFDKYVSLTSGGFVKCRGDFAEAVRAASSDPPGTTLEAFVGARTRRTPWLPLAVLASAD